ncbi:protein arginine kinase [Paenibacillus albiflavus]|uniref:Protein-arginine kinase n=1 Tax=Paenibacillus albiflavus TaxID=2545760 RepID=A0A4R4DX05_9BACL|nr:protein arginine kinase [Paenibacillus albiflavus]TCZ67508.1 protein arginine kinase [Paenibacillus albiflavus]
MTHTRFTNDALSEWMRGEGPDMDVVISSRVRLARNLSDVPFPMLATNVQSQDVLNRVAKVVDSGDLDAITPLTMIPLSDLNETEKRVLVEKHLISPNLANDSRNGAVMLNDQESVAIMINEEDHLRIQSLCPGFQVREAWEIANRLDDIFEEQLDYGYDEKKGYLTSCPTNVGTGIRASVMMHLPALVITQQINRILTAVTQVGLTVRGLYGEGSEAVGNVFQVSNQITLGQSEEEIIDNLHSVVRQIVEHERAERRKLMVEMKTRIIDRVSRSLGILSYAAVIDSKEGAQRISDVRLGVDLGIIKNVPINVLNELLVMTQPGFLQKHAGTKLSADERDMRRAQIIRERMQGDRII